MLFDYELRFTKGPVEQMLPCVQPRFCAAVASNVCGRRRPEVRPDLCRFGRIQSRVPKFQIRKLVSIPPQ